MARSLDRVATALTQRDSWLMAVVDSSTEPVRVVTAFGFGHGRSPDGWTP